MSKRRFDIVETAIMSYSCYLPDDFDGSIADYLKEHSLGDLFERSDFEEIVDYIESDADTINEY